MAASPDGKALVVAMANGGIRRLDIQIHPGLPPSLAPAEGA